MKNLKFRSSTFNGKRMSRLAREARKAKLYGQHGVMNDRYKDIDDPSRTTTGIVVAYYKGKPVGCIITDRIDGESSHANAYVKAKYRRKGIAKAMGVYLARRLKVDYLTGATTMTGDRLWRALRRRTGRSSRPDWRMWW